jgi:hypothetical protein
MTSKFGYLFLFFSLTFLQNVFALDLQFEQKPETPKEGEEVILRLSSKDYDLKISDISWLINGEKVDSGVGRTIFKFNADKNGNSLIVTVVVNQDGIESSTQDIVIAPNTLFIISEGKESYTPPFYKGRNLANKEGIVRAALISFKDGEIVGVNKDNPKSISWSLNGENKKELSGINKIIAEWQAKTIDKNFDVIVNKEDIDGDNKKSAQTNINLKNSDVIIYKTDPFKFLKSVAREYESGIDQRLLVEPFYFSAKSRTDNRISYDWKVGDSKPTLLTPWFIKLGSAIEGEVNLGFKIFQREKLTQELERNIIFKSK